MNRWTKTLRKIIISLIVICLSLLLIVPFTAISIMVNRHVDYRGYATKEYPLQDIYDAKDYGLNENQMYLETEDGLKVWTSEIYTEQPKAVIIYLTGILQPSITYYYGHAKYMVEEGYASILLEVRSHGRSEGNQIGLGYTEVKDVKAVVDYIRSEEKYRDVPIVIQGASMEGAIAINAFGQIGEISGLIAASAYSSVEDQILEMMTLYGVPKWIQTSLEPFCKIGLTWVFGGERVEKLQPVKQIKNANGRPILLMACTGDTEVPPINMERLQRANPDARTWLRDSWEHFIIKDCNFVDVDEDREYWNVIMSFLEDLK